MKLVSRLCRVTCSNKIILLLMFSVVKSLVRPGKFLAPIPNRGIISVFGSQASSFLNGLLSSFIRPQDNGPQFSAVLNAQAGPSVNPN